MDGGRLSESLVARRSRRRRLLSNETVATKGSSVCHEPRYVVHPSVIACSSQGALAGRDACLQSSSDVGAARRTAAARPPYIGIARLVRTSMRAPVSAMTRVQAGAAGTIASLIASGAELASGFAPTRWPARMSSSPKARPATEPPALPHYLDSLVGRRSRLAAPLRRADQQSLLLGSVAATSTLRERPLLALRFLVGQGRAPGGTIGRIARRRG
jgi:hypothetical protein